MLLTGCPSTRISSSAFRANNATDSRLAVDAAVGDTAVSIEGGGLYCEHGGMALLNLTLSRNDAASPVMSRASGGGLAARF